jgi:hypothetical protein
MSDLNPYEEGLANDLAKAMARIKELEAEIRTDALQYLSDVGQMGDTIDDLTRRHERALHKIDVLEDLVVELEDKLACDRVGTKRPTTFNKAGSLLKFKTLSFNSEGAEIDLCPSCREPLSLPSGGGCAAMTKHRTARERKSETT